MGINTISVLLEHYEATTSRKSSRRDLLQWDSHDRTIARRQSVAQTIEGILPYIRNRLLLTWGGVGGCDLHLCHSANEVNVDARNMYPV